MTRSRRGLVNQVLDYLGGPNKPRYLTKGHIISSGPRGFSFEAAIIGTKGLDFDPDNIVYMARGSRQFQLANGQTITVIPRSVRFCGDPSDDLHSFGAVVYDARKRRFRVIKGQYRTRAGTGWFRYTSRWSPLKV